MHSGVTANVFFLWGVCCVHGSRPDGEAIFFFRPVPLLHAFRLRPLPFSSLQDFRPGKLIFILSCASLVVQCYIDY